MCHLPFLHLTAPCMEDVLLLLHLPGNSSMSIQSLEQTPSCICTCLHATAVAKKKSSSLRVTFWYLFCKTGKKKEDIWCRLKLDSKLHMESSVAGHAQGGRWSECRA